MRETNGYKRNSGHLLLLVICFGGVLLLGMLGDDVAQWLRYERDGILSGEVYRMISGHLVHLGRRHALLNVAAAALVWGAYREAMPLRHWLLCVPAIGCFASALLLLSDVQWYVGLSGVLHGVVLLAALRTWKKTPLAGGIVVGALALKIGLEMRFGATAATEALVGGPVVVEAHLCGALAGLSVWALCLLRHAGPVFRRGTGT